MANEKSRSLYDRASNVIPWGTQTNAKRPIESCLPEMPLYIERAKGCRMWDVDGNEYIDYRGALGPIILGYADDDVDRAVKAQLDQGILFSMAAPQEIELAEAVCQFVPGAEMVRFLKTGGDACSAAVRLARAVTGREEIVSIGYHGWHDWTVAGLAGRDLGVPRSTAGLVHRVDYGNASQVSQRFEQSGGDIACIMVTPYDWESEPEASYLQHLRQASDDHGALLIFDEVLTGFRLAMGGAQEYFKIDADLAVFGKALANGYPLSALTGKREIMREMEKIFVTSTHAGELASIAAALATLEKLDRCNVVKDIEEKGDLLMEGICSIFKELDIPGKVVGLPAGFNVSVGDADSTGLEEAFVKRLFANGLFWDYRVSLCYSHSRSDIDETLLRIKTAAREARR